MGNDEPIIATVLPAQLLAELKVRSIPIEDIIRTFDLPETVCEQPFLMAPLSRIRAIGEAAEKASGDTFIGLRAGLRRKPDVFRLLAFACSGARTGREALEMFVKYVSTVHDALVFSLQDHEDGLEVRERIPGHPECLGRQGNEHWVASAILAASEIAEGPYLPMRVTFAHRAPAAKEELVKAFRTRNIVFDAGYNGILFSTAQVDSPVRNTGSPVAVALDRYSVRTSVLPPAPNAFVGRAREAIAERLSEGVPAIGDIARALGMSARTLQRRLADEGLTYFEVLDSVRRDIAILHVERRDLSLDEIAARVGYTQKSAFHRSFRRWTGKTPRGKPAER